MATKKAKAKKEPKMAEDPWKTKEAPTKGKVTDTINADTDELKSKVDEYREFAELEKNYKSKKAGVGPAIKAFAILKNAERQMAGKTSTSFNILGNEKICQFQMVAKISDGTDKHLAEFTEEYGEEATDELFQKDYASLKFNDAYLKANWNEIIPKITKALGDHFAPLFTEMTHKLANDGIEKAKQFADTPEELAEIYTKMKVQTKLVVS